MAFRFFRRHQKAVILVMALLMVAFLIGSQGFSMLTRRTYRAELVGHTSLGEIKTDDLMTANNDVRLLAIYARLGNVEFIAQTGWPLGAEFLMLSMESGRETALAYALLLKEAQARGHAVSGGEIDAFFHQIGLPRGSDGYRTVISLMRARQHGAEKHLRAAVERWLTIHKSFTASRINTPPSERELRHLYRDLNEQIDLRVARISAEDLLDEVDEPSEDEMEQQFDDAKNVFAGNYEDPSSFGFGYRQNDKVRMEYLFVPREPVARATRPSEKKARDHFRANRDKYVRRASTTTQAESAPADPRTEFSDFKGEIMEELHSEAVQGKMEAILGRAETLIAEYERSGSPDQSPYQWVSDTMIRSADEPLSRALETVEIRNEPLDRAIEMLSEAAGLQAICYPYSQQGDTTLDPTVKISLSARGMTLSEALKEIDKQVKSPSTSWVMCDLLDEAIFPDDPDSYLRPIIVGRTDLTPRGETFEDEILDYSATPSGQALSEIAFLVEDLSEARRSSSLVKLNQDGPRMVVSGPRMGLLLWRVVEAIPSRIPETLAEVKEEVVNDLKTKRAFELAVANAKQLAEAAKKDGLEAASEKAKLETQTTGLFARRAQTNPRQEAAMMAMFAGASQQEAIARALATKPIDFPWSRLSDAPLPTEELRRYLVTRCFELVPDQIEPGEGDEPYPLKPYAIGIIELPARREVLVVQREDYVPAVIGEFHKTGRMSLFGALTGMRGWEELQNWFSIKGVVQRVKFTSPES